MFAGKPLPPRHWIFLAAVVALALAVVLPPLINLNRYQRRIAASISHSVGRRVHLSSVTLRLLPLPGFQLSDFWVEEDPQFGAEPILRSSSVTAYLRLSSLWRGKLEIARIYFDDASLNLVRAEDGSWNFGSILLQAAHTANAPTGQRYISNRPRFPYIEATNARINFKRGNEKKPLSFLNSDLSVWLENPDEWGVHFRAQPARTDLDLDLSDTGLLRIDGSLRRAATLAEMPVKLHAEWSSAPLGQLSRLSIGKDVGWRGDLDVQANITGSIGWAQLETRIKIAGLHRAEFVPAQQLDLNTECNASYHKDVRAIEGITCSSSVGSGELLLRGHIRQMQPGTETRLDLDLHRLPASAVLAGLQELRDAWGNGIRAVGELNGHFTYISSSEYPSSLFGEAKARSLTLIPPDPLKPLVLTPVRLAFDGHPLPPATGRFAHRTAIPGAQEALVLQPMRLSLGESTPLSIDGRFTVSGFSLHLSGSGAIARLRGLSRALAGASSSQSSWRGVAGAKLGTRGTATVDLNVHGPWLLPVADSEHPVLPSVTEGTVLLKDVELNAPYLSQPLRITSALGAVHPTDVAWTDVSFGYGELQGEGALEYPTLCTPDNACSGHFTLAEPSLDVGELQSTLQGPGQSGEILQEILSHIDHHAIVWPELSGTFQIGALSLGKLVMHDATGDVEIAGRSMQIRSLDGEMLNGAVHLAGTLEATGDVPNYEFNAQIRNASLTALAALSAEHWGSGAADFSAHWKMSGTGATELISSANGTLHWNWRKGSLATPMSPSTTALARMRFDDWSGDATIEDSGIRIEQSVLTRDSETTSLSGTIAFNRQIDLRSDSESDGFSVTGTLEHPRVMLATMNSRTMPETVVSR
jgi:AsmA family/AsmA-like C-terminal region